MLAPKSGVRAHGHHIDRRAAAIVEQDTADPDALLSTSDTAEWLGVSVQWLEIGRHKGYGPRFLKLSPKVVRYRRADVLAWLTERAHQRTAEYRKRGRAA